MFSFFPQNDPLQALRIRRYLIGASSYLMWMALIIYCYYLGLMRLSLGWIIVAFAFFISINIMFYIIFRTGLNKKCSDPSLTIHQMICAAVGAMVTIYFTDEVRGIMLLAYIVIILFGIFRFRLRQYIIYSLFSMASYSLVIYFLVNNYPDEINLKIELLQWVILAVVLVWFSIIGSYISGLRQRLSASNRNLKTALNTIKELAVHDDLTKAYNRRFLFEELHRQKALADRGGSVFSIAIFDIDHFKQANDTYGHLKGDDILKHLIQILKHEIREVDYLARYGGEEFIIIMSSTDIKGAEECAHRIQETVRSLNFPGFPESFKITISTGITTYSPNESIEQIITRADHALYSAKSAGRNKVATEYPA